MEEPQTGWFILENPIKIDEFRGTPILGKPHIYPSRSSTIPVTIDATGPRLSQRQQRHRAAWHSSLAAWHRPGIVRCLGSPNFPTKIW